MLHPTLDEAIAAIELAKSKIAELHKASWDVTKPQWKNSHNVRNQLHVASAWLESCLRDLPKIGPLV